MTSVQGQGTGSETDRELVRALRTSSLFASVRVLAVGVVVVSAAFAFLFAGSAGQSGAARLSGGTVAPQGVIGGVPAQQPSPAGPSSLGSTPATHVNLTASGISHAGRQFAYGYDLAAQVPKVLNAPAVQVAQSIPGGFEAVPIMGWGEGSPEVTPGVFDFSGIARQLSFVRASGGTPVITLCAAPDWMKGGRAGTSDWTQIATAPLAQHYLDYATLSAAVAKAFPQVKYFVVWNELKGFWNPTSHVTDVAGYTAMYNATYQAVKAVRPDALVGGPYVSVHSLAGPAPSTVPTPSGPWGHLGAEPLENISYWLANKVGADFVAVDGRSFTNDAGLTTDPVTSTAKYAAVDQWLASRTSLPIVWMESHVLPDATTYTLQQQAAVRVAALLEMASSGASLGLQWNPEQSTTWDEGLWTPVGLPGGGQPTPLAQDLPAVLGVLSAPVVLARGSPPGTLVASGPNGAVTVTYSATSASVIVTGPPH